MKEAHEHLSDDDDRTLVKPRIKDLHAMVEEASKLLPLFGSYADALVTFWRSCQRGRSWRRSKFLQPVTKLRCLRSSYAPPRASRSSVYSGTVRVLPSQAGTGLPHWHSRTYSR